MPASVTAFSPNAARSLCDADPEAVGVVVGTALAAEAVGALVGRANVTQLFAFVDGGGAHEASGAGAGVSQFAAAGIDAARGAILSHDGAGLLGRAAGVVEQRAVDGGNAYRDGRGIDGGGDVAFSDLCWRAVGVARACFEIAAAIRSAHTGRHAAETWRAIGRAQTRPAAKRLANQAADAADDAFLVD